MTQDLVGKVFLVTGATDGIGKAAATEFAKRGATLTIVGRNQEKTAQVLAELKDASGNQHLDFLICDLSRRRFMGAERTALRERRGTR